MQGFFFHLHEVLIQRLPVISSVIIFWLKTLKGTAKTPSVELMRLNTLKGCKTAFFQPLIGGTSNSVLLIWESLPQGVIHSSRLENLSWKCTQAEKHCFPFCLFTAFKFGISRTWALFSCCFDVPNYSTYSYNCHIFSSDHYYLPSEPTFTNAML